MKQVRAISVAVLVLVLIVLAVSKLSLGTGTVRRGIARLEIGATAKVRISPDGSRILVVDGGSASVVRLDDAGVIMHTGSNVVDGAWMPDGRRVLVVEGPIPTGEIDTVDMRGRVNGVAHLDPSIGFGNGDGVAVDDNGSLAALVSVTRDDVSGVAHTDLAIVALRTGEVRVYPTARDEGQPLFADDGLVAVATQGAKGPARLDLVNLTTGTVHAGRPIVGGPYAHTFSGEIVVARRAAQGAYRLIGISPVNGKERTLHVTKPHRHVVAVNAQVTRCLVRVLDKGGTAHLAIEAFA